MDESVRLADLLVGLSLISDHGLGLPPDDAVRTCLVGTALARELDLDEREVADVFYDALLEHIGCMGYAHETARVWGDDLAANRAAQRTNFADPRELFTAYLSTLLRDVQGRERVQVATRFFTCGAPHGALQPDFLPNQITKPTATRRSGGCPFFDDAAAREGGSGRLLR